MLVAHPASPPKTITGVEVDVAMTDGDDMLLSYRVKGDLPSTPKQVSPTRADALWKTTCFEIFIRPRGGDAYFEFNFSPSGQWAAYVFDRYREGMRDLAISIPPMIEPMRPEDGSVYGIETDLDLSEIPDLLSDVSIAAVIEEVDGTKSYWALAHPTDRPDFHHPDGFVLELPPA